MPRRNAPYRAGAPIVAELAGGAVVVRDGTDPPQVLLLHLAEERRWCLPKGHVEPGESLEAAAAREVAEESGLTDLRLGEELTSVAYRFYRPARRENVHKSVVYFLGRSAGRELRLEPLFDRGAWEPLPRALELVPFETDRSVLREAARRLVGAPPRPGRDSASPAR